MLKAYINQTTTLNHLDLSGIDFNIKHIKDIAESISNSSVLLAVHLNDMDINNNKRLAKDLLEIFDIESSRF
jgi:hypothetical protein